MSVSINVHHASGLRVYQRMTGTCKFVTLSIQHEGGLESTVTIFDLPAHVTEALIASLGAPKHELRSPVAHVLEAAE